MKNDVFNMPKPVTIMGRSSSITNSLVNGIIPTIEPTDEEIKEALKILGQSEDDVRCVYCGDKKTEWDHLHPLIVKKEHTGYITEIANLVPACGKCNQSKGNKDWKEWMLSDAKKSPKSRDIPDLEKRIQIIEEYDQHFHKEKINLEEIAGKELWEKYQEAYKSIISEMEAAQEIMDEIKQKTSKLSNSASFNITERSKTEVSLPVNVTKATVPVPIVNDRKKTVVLNGITIPIYRGDNQSVQDFVQQTLNILFGNNLLSANEINLLQDKKYCSNTFGISYPLLEKDKGRIYDDKDRRRYWAEKTFKIGEFYVCSQWGKKNFDTYDRKIASWLASLEK